MSPGFKNWKNALDGKNGYIDRHTHSEAHKAAEEKAALFSHIHQPGMNIIAKISKHVAKQQVRTYKGISSIIDIILALGQRGIPFRGNWERQRCPKMEISLSL